MSWWATSDVQTDRALFYQRATARFAEVSAADLLTFRPGNTPIWRHRPTRSQQTKE